MSARIIDAHCHLVPLAYRAALEHSGRLMEDGFPCPDWNIDSHRTYMAETGIATSILSISSPHQMSGVSEEDLQLTGALNDEMAAISRADEKAFRFAACLPLPLVEASVREACRVLDELGAAAVKFPSNALGLYPGDPVLAPLMDALDARRAVVILHPCKPPAVPEGCFTAGPLPLFEFLGDTTRAVINLIAQNTVARWPNVRYVIPHMGSFLPPLVDRLSGITNLLASKGIGEAIDARRALDAFYFDLAGDTLDAPISALLTITSPEHLLFGGDYPYTPAPLVRGKIEKLLHYPLLQPYLDDILENNAVSLFEL